MNNGAASVPSDLSRDDHVLLLRDEGRSFAGIARALDLAGALEANAAFNRALRRRVPSEQAALRSRETARLDALGERLRKREDLSEEELARQLHGLKRLRKTLSVE
jgi:DNA-binding transcriptional MerR regulator